ncbi:MAG: integrin [Comamonadaceae bacterium]|nr:MAG: integrin [Comamonadaceae bacterium]
MRRLLSPLVPLLAALLLAACSGGSSDGSPGSGSGIGAGGGTDSGADIGAGPGAGAGSDGTNVPPSALYRVGGQLSGLGSGKTVVLGDASGPRVSLSDNGVYSLQLAAGTAYDLKVLAQPAGQVCEVINGVGNASADVDNIDVRCLDDAGAGGGTGGVGGAGVGAQVIGGVVSGLGASKTVMLQLQAASLVQEAHVVVDGRFAFAQPVTGAYSVTVRTQPTGQVCTVTNGQGQSETGTSVPDVAVRCAAQAFKLSGTLSGNSGTVVLRNAVTGESVTVVNNGNFFFAQPVHAGGAYAVSVAAAVAAGAGYTQSCSVANGSGTANADVQIAVTCATQAAPVTPPTPVAVPSAPSGSLTMGYDVKAFKLGWSAVAAPAGGGAVTYRVFEDADGPGPGTATQVATGLSATSYTQPVAGLLMERLNASYTVQACNTAGCSAHSAPAVVNVNKAIGYFKASNTDAGDNFGWDVALSGDGTTLAVGAFFEDSNATGINGNQADNSVGDAGAVYVFNRTAGVWAQQAYLKASNTHASQKFSGVALSADGNTLAVSAFGDDSNATGVGGNQSDTSADHAGAVFVFSRSGAVWSQQAYVKASNTEASDYFGRSIALSASGDRLAVGASGEDSSATGVNGDQADNSARSSGAVYVFARLAGIWSQEAYIKAGTTRAYANFGLPVALSGDGLTLAVGALGDGSNATGINGDQSDSSASSSGAVWVFVRTGSSWGQQAYVKASNTNANDGFGISISLAADGNTLAVGAPYEESSATGIDGNQGDNAAPYAGAAYVFSRTGAAWSQQAYVKASNAEAFDVFGSVVVLSGDGNTLAVGALFESSASAGIGGSQADNSSTDAGAVYVFSRTGSAWRQKNYVKASNPAAGNQFGEGLALSADGKTMAVGAKWEGSNATGINGDATNVSAPESGAVYLY